MTSMRSGDLTGSTNEELMTSKAGGEPIGNLPSSNENPTTCNGSDATVSSGLCSSSGSDGDIWDCLSVPVSKIARSVISVFLLDGDTNVFTCSGIPIERNLSFTRVLTSANLATTMRSKRKLGFTIRIQVRDAFSNVAHGCLEHCELDNGIALVKVTEFLDVCEVHLHHGVEIRPHSDLVAIQLTDSGGVVPVKGILTKDSRASEGW